MVAISEVCCDNVVFMVPMLVSMVVMVELLVSTLVESVSSSPSKLLKSVLRVETVLDSVVMLVWLVPMLDEFVFTVVFSEEILPSLVDTPFVLLAMSVANVRTWFCRLVIDEELLVSSDCKREAVVS